MTMARKTKLLFFFGIISLAMLLLTSSVIAGSSISKQEEEVVNTQTDSTLTTVERAVQYPPLSIDELEDLYERGEIQAFTVRIHAPQDIPRLRATGVIIETKELKYVVVLGDQKRVNAVRSLGFTLRESVENDHKRRRIRVWIDTKEQLEELHRIASDVWPANVPSYVYGQAFDFEIELLRQYGYRVENCGNKPCAF